MKIFNIKKSNKIMKILIYLAIILIVGLLCFLIIYKNLNKNTAGTNPNGITNKINNYLDNLVKKTDVENSIYYSAADNGWVINKGTFEITYLNYFFKDVHDNYVYDFELLNFIFSFSQNPLIATTTINYHITNYNKLVVGTAIVNFEWTKKINKDKD